jgi:hypothetical protein
MRRRHDDDPPSRGATRARHIFIGGGLAAVSRGRAARHPERHALFVGSGDRAGAFEVEAAYPPGSPLTVNGTTPATPVNSSATTSAFRRHRAPTEDNPPTAQGYRDGLALCIVDSVQSTGVTYTSVVNGYRRYQRQQGGNPETDGAPEKSAIRTRLQHAQAHLMSAVTSRQSRLTWEIPRGATPSTSPR